MGMHYLIQAIFVLVGLLSVLAALFNWEWFFTAHNTQFIVSNAGRQRARLFYAILGLLMIATGIYFFLNIQGIVKTHSEQNLWILHSPIHRHKTSFLGKSRISTRPLL